MERKNIHGGNIYKFAAAKGIVPSSVVDFSANINPLGMSAVAKKHCSQGLMVVFTIPIRARNHCGAWLPTYLVCRRI